MPNWQNATQPKERVQILAPLLLALPGGKPRKQQDEEIEALFAEISEHESQPATSVKTAEGEVVPEGVLHPERFPILFSWITSLAAGPNGRGTMLNESLTAGPQAVCGKILTRQEVAYKCLDCGADPTCVMCVDCFNRSPCQNHEYRMVRSGGGMCDCGDPTAWKPESFCDCHRGLTADQDPTMHIPEENRNWINTLIKYSMRLFLQLADALHRNDCALIVRQQQQGGAELPQSASALKALGEYLIQLASTGDSGKRLIGAALASPLSKVDFPSSAQTTIATDSILTPVIIAAVTSADKDFLVMDAVLYYETECRRPTAQWLDCWQPVRQLMELVLSDPIVKPVYTSSLMFFMERAQRHYAVMESEKMSKLGQKATRVLMQSSVQTLTVPPVIAELMTPGAVKSYAGFFENDAAKKQNLAFPTQTLLHRLLAGHMLALTFAVHTDTSGGLPAIRLRATEEETSSSLVISESATTASKGGGTSSVKGVVKNVSKKAKSAATGAMRTAGRALSRAARSATTGESRFADPATADLASPASQRQIFTFRVGKNDSMPRSTRRSGDEIALFHSVHNFRYTLLASSQSGASVFSSRSLLRALLNIYQVEQVSGITWRLPDAKTNYNLAFDLEYSHIAGLWNLVEQLKELLDAVCKGELDKLVPPSWQHAYLKEIELRDDHEERLDEEDQQASPSTTTTAGGNSFEGTSSPISIVGSQKRSNKVWGIPGGLNFAGLPSLMLDSSDAFSSLNLYSGFLKKCRDGPVPPRGPPQTGDRNGAAEMYLSTPTLLLDSEEAHLDSVDRMVSSVCNMTNEMIPYLLEVSTVALNYATGGQSDFGGSLEQTESETTTSMSEDLVTKRSKTHSSRSLFLQNDPLNEKLQGVTFNQPLSRIFALTAVSCLNALNKHKTPSKSQQSSALGGGGVNEAREGVLQKLFHTEKLSFEEMTNLIDQPLLNFVVSDQVFSSQWERDHMDIKSRCKIRDVNATYFIEVFLLYLQLATGAVGARRMASQLLDRYSYTPHNNDKSRMPNGYGQFLQLVLQMVCDAGKTNEKMHAWQQRTGSADPSFVGGSGLSKSAKKELEGVDPVILQKIVQRLSLTPCPRSELMKVIHKSDVDEEEEQTEIDGQVSTVLRHLCKEDSRRGGNFYSLKQDEAVWSLVCPYSCAWRPNYVHLSKRQYLQMNAEKAKNLRGKSASGVTCYPTAKIGNHSEQLALPIRSLLHQKTTLSVAIALLVNYVLRDSKRDINALEVDLGSVSFAVDALHLGLQDIKMRFSRAAGGAITKILWRSYEESLTAAIASESSLAPGPRTSGTSASYESMSPFHFPPGTSEGLHNALLVKCTELNLPQKDRKIRKFSSINALSGLEALRIFSDCCEDESASTQQAELAWKVRDLVSTVSKYEEFVKKREENPELASEEEEDDDINLDATPDDDGTGKTVISAAEAKRKAAAKKQAAALAKMKARAKATLDANAQAEEAAKRDQLGMSSSENSFETTNTSDLTGSADQKKNQVPSLLPTIESHLTSLECVYCGRPGEDNDPLLLLAHTSTSASLDDLELGQQRQQKKKNTANVDAAPQGTKVSHRDAQDPQRDLTDPEENQARSDSEGDEDDDDKYMTEVKYCLDKPLNSGLLCCGHAARLSCLVKQQMFQARVEARGSWRDLFMQGQAYRGMEKVLSPEILCPICGRICRGLLIPPKLHIDKRAGGSTICASAQEIMQDNMYEASIGFNKNVESPAVKPVPDDYIADAVDNSVAMVRGFVDTMVMTSYGISSFGQPLNFRQLVTLRSGLKTVLFRHRNSIQDTSRDGAPAPRPPLTLVAERIAVQDAIDTTSGVDSEGGTSPSSSTLRQLTSRLILQLLLAHDAIEDHAYAQYKYTSEKQSVHAAKIERFQTLVSEGFTSVITSLSTATPIEEENKEEDTAGRAQQNSLSVAVLFALIKLVFTGNALPSQINNVESNDNKITEILAAIANGEETEDMAATILTTDLLFEELDLDTMEDKEERLAVLTNYIVVPPSSPDSGAQEEDASVTTTTTSLVGSINALASYAATISPMNIPPILNVDTGYDYLFEKVLYFPKTYAEYVKHMTKELAAISSRGGKIPKKPALCLRSRKVFSLEGKPPELFEHTRECGGTALFLCVKQNLYLAIQASSGRASQISSPYVDRYGEKDPGLSRGVPLRLQTDRARDLVKTWFFGSFDHQTEILANTWSRKIKQL